MTDHSRLEFLINTHEDTLYRAALAILGDVCEAEDAVQDAFLRCWEKAPEFDSPEHAKAWLLRVLAADSRCYNCCCYYNRSYPKPRPCCRQTPDHL